MMPLFLLPKYPRDLREFNTKSPFQPVIGIGAVLVEILVHRLILHLPKSAGIFVKKMRPVNTLRETDKQEVATCKPSKDHVKNYLVGRRDPNIV